MYNIQNSLLSIKQCSVLYIQYTSTLSPSGVRDEYDVVIYKSVTLSEIAF